MNQLEAKKFILHSLESNDLEAVVQHIRENRKTLSLLIRLAYDKETLVGWRAIKAMGLIAKALGDGHHEFLRTTVRKLLWSLSDESGGIGWAAPELLGEIVSSDPERFSDIVPLIAEVYDIEEMTFRPGVVYALARIAEVSPAMVAVYQEIILRSLIDTNPLIKIYALDLISRIWTVACRNKLWSRDYQNKIKNAINNMKLEREVAWIYKDTAFTEAIVGESANFVLNELSQ